MRGTGRVDPSACRYGAATPAVQQILREWLAIDWFEPPCGDGAARAAAAFVEHQRRAHAYAPDLFAATVDVRTVQGRWAKFAELCKEVRTPSSWDWKFSAIKPLSRRHAKDLGWSLQEWARAEGAGLVPHLDAGQSMGAGDLFFRLGDGVIYNNPGPELDLAKTLPADHAEAGQFYLSYAVMEMMEAAQWQLAEPTADLLAENPFLPLLRCYAGGLHPFALGRERFVLFAFQ